MGLLRSVHNALEANAFVPYAHIYSLVYGIASRRVQNGYLRSAWAQPLRELPIGRIKKSNTLFILGSGASVNEYGEKEWAEIRSHDSVGLNFWLVHDFVPDLYVIEPPRAPRDAYLYELLAQRAGDYERVPFILKPSFVARLDLQRVPESLRDRFYVGRTLPLPGRSRERTVRAYSLYRKHGLDAPGGAIDEIVQKRASVDGLLHLAFAWGYKEVVLCGVDLNNTRYFYDECRDQYLEKGRSVPSTGQESGIHRTMDPSLTPVTVESVISVLNETLLKPHGIKLRVALSSSALYPEIPAYFR